MEPVLLDSIPFMKSTVRRQPLILEHCDDSIKEDEGICEELLKKNGLCL